MEEVAKATAVNDRLQNMLDAQDQNVELLKKELNEMKAMVDDHEKSKAADKVSNGGYHGDRRCAGARCSSVVRAVAHDAMGRRIDPSLWTH